MEGIDSATLHHPQLIHSGLNQVLVMTDHQHAALECVQTLHILIPSPQGFDGS